MSLSADVSMAENKPETFVPGARVNRTAWRWLRCLAFAAAAITLSSVTTGCLVDFDEFDERATPIADAADAADTADAADAGDTDPPDSADADIEPDQPAIGSQCQADADCGDDLVCRGSLCTRECSADDQCPESTSCRRVGVETLCLADCDAEDSCAGVADRDDLKCVTLVGDAEMGAPASGVNSCMGDEDGDSVGDLVDNCPQVSNPTQVDRDGDGQGDACDDEPLCHALADNGLLDFGTTTYEHADFRVPETTTLDWLPVIGGEDDTGAPVASKALLDRSSGEWIEADDFLYAASGRAVAATTGDRYVVTPGTLGDDEVEFGAHILLARDGTSELGPDYSLGLHDKTMATTGLGQLLVHGYSEDADSTTNDWQVRRYEPANGQYQTVTTGEVTDRVDWHATADLQGNVIIYSQVQPALNVMRILRFDPLGQPISSNNVQLPSREPPATGRFNPFLLAGPGNVLYAFDRDTGSAVRIDQSSGSVSRVSELDLNISPRSARFVSVPGSPSFILIERDSDDATQLQAREFFLPCLPGTNSLDSDGDNVADLIDNCPVVENANQADADNDLIGDACDDDADNDGIPNDSDFVLDDDEVTEISMALDTDNDGTPNESDDDFDADGIPNSADRFPFDTDNDGVPNWLDDDDDGDGYSDADERSSDSDPLDPVSFPDVGTVSWVRETDAGRTIEYAPIPNTGDVTSLTDVSGEPSHQPRFFGDGSRFFALAGEPGTATGVQLIAANPGADTPIETFETGETLFGATLTDASFDADDHLTSLIAVHPHPDDPDLRRLSTVDLAEDTFTPLFTVFGDVASPSAADSQVAFVGAPDGCVPCRQPYVVSTSGGTPSALTSAVEAPTGLRYDGSALLMVARASSGEGTSAWRLVGSRITELRPPGTIDVDSVAGVGSSGHVVVSARSSADASYNLWLYNTRTDTWHSVSSGDDDLIDIDWVASVPPLPEPVDDTEQPR